MGQQPPHRPAGHAPDEVALVLVDGHVHPAAAPGVVVGKADPVIGEVLQYLTPQRREVILLYYFLDYNDAEIGRLLQIDNTTVQYRRHSALKQLKKLVEDMQNE